MRAPGGLSPFLDRPTNHPVFQTSLSRRAGLRGTALAELIVDAVLAYARTRVELIQLSVATTNGRAVRFYERLGFVKYVTEPKALKLGNEYVDEFLLVKFLGL